MDLETLLAARREASRDPAPIDDLASAERDLIASRGERPSLAWIERAARVVEEHQLRGRGERAWPLLRLMEPCVADRAADEPAIAGRVLASLASQALLEGAAEAFLDRVGRAADALDRAGDHGGQAAIERALHGAALLAFGMDDEAGRALDAAVAGAERAGLTIAGAAARRCRAWLGARRGRAIAELDANEIALAKTNSERPPYAIGWLAGGPAPGWIAIADARAAAGDAEGAAAAVAEARRAVLAFASKIARADLRKSYLERVPEHRRALSLDSP